jgi:hypothetical protein
MANSNPFFTFLAGAITGAALLILANTDKGVEVMEDIKEKGSEALNDGRAAVLNGLDKLEDALKKKRAEQQAAADAEEEEAE